MHPTGPGLRRVVVHADSRRVDLALPAALPIDSLMPAIVDIFSAEGAPVTTAVRHQLSLPGNAALDSSKTLVQLGIRDGSALLLTSASTVLTPPRFDDVAEAVSVSLAAHRRSWTRPAARLSGALAASWLAATSAAILMKTPLDTNDVRRGGCAGVAAVAGVVALLAAVVAYRVFRDATVGLTSGLAAVGFAAVAGLLAVPGRLGAPNTLLAMAATATLASAMRVISCHSTLFTGLACFATVESAAAAVAALSAAPLPAIGAASAVISLIIVEAAAPVSMMLAGLSSQVAAESPPNRLKHNALRADAWLTSLLAGFSAAVSLGAIGAAAGSLSGGRPPWLGLAFAVATGGVLLLRARSHRELARSVSLVVAGTATLSGTLVIAAVAYPRDTPYLAAASIALAAAALCLGFITQTTTFSPSWRRSVELLEYLALAAVVPVACWLCGLYGAARGINLP